MPHDVVDSNVEFYVFENQKTIALEIAAGDCCRRLLPEIAAFSDSVLGDRKGQSVTIKHIYHMSNAAKSLNPPGRDMQRVLVSV